MAGRGAAPKPAAQRRTRHAPQRGEYTAAKAVGWAHGAVPEPPEGLMPATIVAWATWMSSWFAAHWKPADLPGLRQVIRLYDQVERGEFVRMTELRQMMDNYGITPKGQQDRRWVEPKADADAQVRPETPAADASPYRHLRALG